MASRVNVDGTEYRFHLYSQNIRGDCPRCHQRGDLVSFRVTTPQKRRIRVCYECLFRFALECEEIIKIAAEASKRIDRFREKEKPKDVPTTIDPVVHISGKETCTQNHSITSAGSDSKPTTPD